MTDTPKKIIVDCSTGEATEVELTAEEIAQLETDRATAEADRLAREEETAAKLAARESALAKLAALGLTDDEIAAL